MTFSNILLNISKIISLLTYFPSTTQLFKSRELVTECRRSVLIYGNAKFRRGKGLANGEHLRINRKFMQLIIWFLPSACHTTTSN